MVVCDKIFQRFVISLLQSSVNGEFVFAVVNGVSLDIYILCKDVVYEVRCNSFLFPSVAQGCRTYFLARTKNNFTVGLKDQGTVPGITFEN